MIDSAQAMPSGMGAILQPQAPPRTTLLATIRQAFHLIGRNQRKRWFVLVLLALVNSLLEIMAAALIYVLLAVVTDPSGRIELPLLGDVRRFAPGVDDRTLLLGLALVMIGFFVVRAVVQIGAEYVTARVIHMPRPVSPSAWVRGYLDLPTPSTSRATPRNSSATGTRPCWKW